MSALGLVLTRTSHGYGTDPDDGASAAGVSLPSWAPSGASGLSEDFNVDDLEKGETQEHRPEWADDDQATDGTWGERYLR